jgi:hypothetical protein
MPYRRPKRPIEAALATSAVVQGLASIERGDFIELHTQEDLRRYFMDIIERGKIRLAAGLTAEAPVPDVAPKD